MPFSGGVCVVDVLLANLSQLFVSTDVMRGQVGLRRRAAESGPSMRSTPLSLADSLSANDTVSSATVTVERCLFTPPAFVMHCLVYSFS